MRIGYKYHVVRDGAPVRTTIAATPEEHSVENQYGQLDCFRTQGEFLKSDLFSSWMLEAHECYKTALKDAGRILSIGSGIGEHDVLLHLAGYDIVSTDLIPGVSRNTQSLFPDMEFGVLDILDRSSIDGFRCDSVLITGLDFTLDDSEAGRMIENVAHLLKRSTHRHRKMILTLRYRDNILTKGIDWIVLPLEARLRLWKRGRGHTVVKKAHGYRRSCAEALELAFQHGFRLRQVYYAGAGMELTRSVLVGRIRPLMWLLRRLDRIFHVACNCVICEFSLPADGKIS
jgi:hypothetical protein